MAELHIEIAKQHIDKSKSLIYKLFNNNDVIDKAITEYLKAIQKYNMDYDYENIALTYIEIAKIYIGRNDIMNAIYNFQLSYDNYILCTQYKNAICQCNNALFHLKNNFDINLCGSLLYKMAIAYDLYEKYDESIEYYEKALICLKINILDIDKIYKIYDSLAKLYILTNQFKNASNIYIKIIDYYIKHSLFIKKSEKFYQIMTNNILCLSLFDLPCAYIHLSKYNDYQNKLKIIIDFLSNIYYLI